MGLRLIWHSNAAWTPSGYGQQTYENAKRIQKMPEVEQLIISAYYGLHGGIVEYEDMIHIPPRTPSWGNDCLQLHSYHTNSDVVISLMDLWVLNPDIGQKGFIFCPWLPIDHDNIPPLVLERMRAAYMPITMSQFGYELARNAKVGNVRYVPHSINTKMYKPHSKKVADEQRQKLGIPTDVFLIGIVAANKGWPSRKAIPQMMEAASIFIRKHPDVYIYFHTMHTAEEQGADIPTVVRHFGIADRTVLPNPYLYAQGYPQHEMSKIYSTFDVFLLASMGEGFGVPIIEAQSCGVPVIVTDFSAMPELVAPGGHKVGYTSKWYTPMDAFQVMPSVDDIVDRLEYQYNLSAKDTKTQRKVAREFIVNNYDADEVVAKYWRPIIKELDNLTAKRTLKLAS